eukprot:COSAG01_NODE_8054_length_2918_cov_9.946089_1_plen_37_part_10
MARRQRLYGFLICIVIGTLLSLGVRSVLDDAMRCDGG